MYTSITQTLFIAQSHTPHIRTIRIVYITHPHNSKYIYCTLRSHYTADCTFSSSIAQPHTLMYSTTHRKYAHDTADYALASIIAHPHTPMDSTTHRKRHPFPQQKWWKKTHNDPLFLQVVIIEVRTRWNPIFGICHH